MVLHVRFESLYISLPSSAKQQREMTQCRTYFGERVPQWLIFRVFFGIERCHYILSLSRVLDL